MAGNCAPAGAVLQLWSTSPGLTPGFEAGEPAKALLYREIGAAWR
jgi:hypothetical protein